MFSLDQLLAPLAVIMLSPSTEVMEPSSRLMPAEIAQSGGLVSTCWTDSLGLATIHRPELLQQIRMERRVIVRVAPFPSPRRSGVMPEDALEFAMPPRFEERRAIRCVSIRDVSGVRQASDNRLVLFLRKSRPVSARLEKGCSARDFYSGFYVEDSEDGQLCIGRDTLHSRAGATCTLTRLHRLHPAED